MRKLTVLFDAKCALCRRARLWLLDERAFVPLEFIPAQSETARVRFPDLDHEATLGDLTVIGDDRNVYKGARAWIMCLWALQGYRGLAVRLSSKGALPLAKRFVYRVARNRYHISAVLEGLKKVTCQ